MRLIDADAIRYDQLLNIGNKEHPLEWAVSRPLIDAMPTIEAEPTKHGRWLPSKDGHGCECSECGTAYRWSEADTMRYCKKCGARMDGTNKSVESVDLGNGFSISVNKSQFDTQGRYCTECLYSPTCYGASIGKPACKAFVPRVRYVDGKDGGEE